MKIQEQLNILYDTLEKVKLVESVLAYQELPELKEIIKVKHGLTKKVNELNNKLYDQNKKAR